MNHRNISCSKCEKEFHCLRDEEKCWCHTWHIPKEVANNIQALYDDCLCADCLKEVLNERSKNNNQG